MNNPMIFSTISKQGILQENAMTQTHNVQIEVTRPKRQIMLPESCLALKYTTISLPSILL